jgi:small-conductance mechanosensitive channel
LTNNPDPLVPGANLDSVQHWEDIVNSVLAASLASSLVLLAEKTLIQLISVNYHRMQYDLKIKESKHNVHILSMLYDASIAQFPAYCPEFQEEDYIINDSPDMGSSKGHQRSGSATPLRLLANVGRFGDKITAAFGNIAQEVTGKEVFNPTSAHSVVVEALEKTRPSEALAKRIWMSLVAEGKEALYQEDLIEVLADQPQSVAIEAFQVLDNDGNGDVTLDEMILKVCEIGRARKAIAHSLHDVDQAINVLDNLLLTGVLLICVFIFIAFLNRSFVTTLATAGTALLSLSFVFSGTAQEVLGSCIFLFVKHPFDVGDIVNINSQQLVVERVSLLYTVFKCTKSHTTTQCPNVVLNGLWIDNITRSKAMREQLFIYVSFDTTLEDIELLRKEMQNFVLDKENSRDFEPEIEVEVTSIAEMNKMELKIQIKHKVKKFDKLVAIMLIFVVKLVQWCCGSCQTFQVHVCSCSCTKKSTNICSWWWRCCSGLGGSTIV